MRPWYEYASEHIVASKGHNGLESLPLGVAGVVVGMREAGEGGVPVTAAESSVRTRCATACETLDRTDPSQSEIESLCRCISVYEWT